MLSSQSLGVEPSALPGPYTYSPEIGMYTERRWPRSDENVATFGSRIKELYDLAREWIDLPTAAYTRMTEVSWNTSRRLTSTFAAIGSSC